MNKKFKELKEKNGKQNATDMASQLLKDITMEAEKLKEDVKRKLKQIEGQYIIKHTVLYKHLYTHDSNQL